jgi:hypothetical protein
MCGTLNPAVFRYAEPGILWKGSVFKKMGKGKSVSREPCMILSRFALV